MADITQLQWLINAVDKMRQNRPAQNPALPGQPQSMQNYLGDIGAQNKVRAQQQPAYSPAVPVAPRIQPAIEGMYSGPVARYDPNTGAIYLIGRRSGRVNAIPVGAYSLQNDAAYTNPYLAASSPGFQNMVNLVKAWQEANPVYVPFPAGTPTLERQKFDEAKRQFELGHALELRKQAETERRNRVSEALGGDASSKMSATEAKAFNKGAAMQIIKNKIDEAWKRGGWAAAVEALPGIQDWFMGTYYPELIRGGLDNNDIQDILVYARSLIGGDLSKIPFPKLSDKNTGGSGAPVSIAPNTANPQ